MFRTQLPVRDLAEICYRVGTGLEAGVDIRRCWQREAERGSGNTAHAAQAVHRALVGGSSLVEALEQQISRFPLMMRSMVQVGELSGGLERVLLQLAEYYRRILATRREVMRVIAWPLIELVLAIGIVGFLIFVPALLPQINGQPQDLLGFGLVGVSGLLIYLAFLASMAFGVFMVYQLLTQPGKQGASLLVACLERIPGVGAAFRDMALFRVAWSLALTTNTEMDLRDALRLALGTALLPRIARTQTAVVAQIARGRDLHSTLAATQQLPAEFLDVVEVSEQTGTLSEGFQRLANMYDERARYSLQRLGMFTGLAIWGVIGMILISLIFRLYGNYLSVIQGGF